MSGPRVPVDATHRRRMAIAADPIRALLIVERAVVLSGGRIAARRPGGFDFACRTRLGGVRWGAADAGHRHGRTLVDLRMDWTRRQWLSAVAAILALAAVALPLGARWGPIAFAATAAILTSVWLGLYLGGFWTMGRRVARIGAVTRQLSETMLYRADPPRVRPADEVRRLIGGLCAGRILPSDFMMRRRTILAQST